MAFQVWTLNLIRKIKVSQSESLQLIESNFRTIEGYRVAGASNITIVAMMAVIYGSKSALSETMQIVEALNANIILLSEIVVTQAKMHSTTTETVSVGEAQAARVGKSSQVAESVTVADSTVAITRFRVSLQEPIPLIEALNSRSRALVTISDSMAVTDKIWSTSRDDDSSALHSFDY